uniref:Tyrosyl-DNA phosphodiesterase n=1 Tax=Globisporangium ultimum (strain ATCC 200006 / CBS 805.95 / DAOM BR144) TaxID=431595 RepID=K3WH37_GLOUD
MASAGKRIAAESESAPPKRLKRGVAVAAEGTRKNDDKAHDKNGDVGFHLTQLKNAPEAHNQDTVGIADLLAGEFTKVLLTNYMFDMPWLFGECPRLHDVPVLLVHGERDRLAMANECKGYTNVSLVAPYLPIPYGTHHTKMMVVVYPTKVRVAIFTANFIAIDWNNKTQGVWFQDFELKTLDDDDDAERKECASNHNADGSNSVALDFEADLVGYLSRLGTKVTAFCKEELVRFDFSTAKVALVPSVPGVHTGKGMHAFAIYFSSMGSLDEKWLFGEFAASLLPGKKGITATSAPIQAFHIVWPSVDDVRNSIEGWNAGRAVPCPLKNMKPFLHKYLRKWNPPEALHRKNAMPHIKTYARVDASSEHSGALDWAILTSSNLSKAAWGVFQKNQTQFMIRSYELGVMFLPQLLPASTAFTVIGSKAAAINAGTGISSVSGISQRPYVLPLPYGFPIKTYDPKVDEPWVWDLVRDEPDIFGSGYFPR